MNDNLNISIKDFLNGTKKRVIWRPDLLIGKPIRKKIQLERILKI